MRHLQSLVHILAVYHGDKFLTKFLWSRLGGIALQLFGRGGDGPYLSHGVGAYHTNRQTEMMWRHSNVKRQRQPSADVYLATI